MNAESELAWNFPAEDYSKRAGLLPRGPQSTLTSLSVTPGGAALPKPSSNPRPRKLPPGFRGLLLYGPEIGHSMADARTREGKRVGFPSLTRRVRAAPAHPCAGPCACRGSPTARTVKPCVAWRLHPVARDEVVGEL